MLLLGTGIGFVLGVIFVDWVAVRPAIRINDEAIEQIHRLTAKLEELLDDPRHR